MTLKTTIMTMGLLLLAPNYSLAQHTKTDESPLEKSPKPVVELTMDYEGSERAMNRIGGHYENLEEGSRTTEFFSHSATPWNIDIRVKTYTGRNSSEIKNETPLEEIACKARRTNSHHFDYGNLDLSGCDTTLSPDLKSDILQKWDFINR